MKKIILVLSVIFILFVLCNRVKNTTVREPDRLMIDWQGDLFKLDDTVIKNEIMRTVRQSHEEYNVPEDGQFTINIVNKASSRQIRCTINGESKCYSISISKDYKSLNIWPIDCNLASKDIEDKSISEEIADQLLSDL